MFNLVSFVKTRGIHYVDVGSNVARGHINIKCPWCGIADKSEHLGINVKTSKWGCWRDPSHRGNSPVRLVAKLLGVPISRAATIVGTDVISWDGTESDFWKARNSDPFAEPKQKKKRESLCLEYPADFRDVGDGLRASKPFVEYLQRRGFVNLRTFSKWYDIKYAITGKWSGRLIIPVTYGGKLVTWTARSIYKSASIRYLTLSEDEQDGQSALVNIKKLAYNYDDLAACEEDTLVIVEGPFDALKLDYYAKQYGVRATCVFGKVLDHGQLLAFSKLVPKFKRVFVALDADEQVSAMRLADSIPFSSIDLLDLPDGVDDPGDLTADQVAGLCKRII